MKGMGKKNVVILGAGFGGITAALTLAKKLKKYPDYELILIDKNPYQLFTPALYEIASVPSGEARGTLLKSAVVIPIEDIVAGKNITFKQGETIGLDKMRPAVVVRNVGALPYNYLLFALGSETNYFNIPGLREHAYPLKQFEDAVHIRNKIETLLKQNRPIEVVVGGAGASGIELVAEFSNFVCTLQKKILQDHPLCRVHLVLVEAAPGILSGFDQTTIQRTQERLKKLGIEVKNNFTITEITPREVRCKDGKDLPYDLFVWTGGVKGNSLFQLLGLPTTPRGNLVVDQYLEVEPRIFAVGDCAGFIDPATGKQLIWNVPVAEEEARLAAKNIIRDIRGKKKIAFRARKRYPFVMTVGQKYALADLIFIRLTGFWGWLIKILVELRYLLKVLPPAKALRRWLHAVKTYISND